MLSLRHNVTHAVPALPGSTVAVSAVLEPPFGYRRLDSDAGLAAGIPECSHRDDERRHDVPVTAPPCGIEVRRD